MSPLDALWHLLNFLGPAFGVTALASGLTKLLWRRELANVRWARLWLWSAGVASVVTIIGLAWLGRDGKMATYGAMVVGCALTLWWAGFGRR